MLEKRQLPKRLKTDHKLQVAEARKAARNKKDESSKEKLRKVGGSLPHGDVEGVE